MTKISYTTTFECTPERLWEFLEDPEKLKLWMKGVVEDRMTTPPPTRVGSRFVMSIREGRKVSHFDGEITGYDRLRLMQLRMTGGSFPKGCFTEVEYRLTDFGNRTQLDYACDFVTTGVFMRIMAAVFMPLGKIQLKSFLKTLKRLAEGTGELAPSR